MNNVAITKVSKSKDTVNTKEKFQIYVTVKEVRGEGTYLAVKLATKLRGNANGLG